MKYVEFDVVEWPVARPSRAARAAFMLLGSLADLWTMTNSIYDELKGEVE